MLMAAAGMLRKKTAGVFHAPELALSAISEGLAVNLDTGLDIEARYFVELAVSDSCKDMIRTLWYGRSAALKCEGLPTHEGPPFTKIAIIGAGMMGAGLAFVCADAGYEVVLKDVHGEALEKARAHFESQLKRRRKHLSESQRDAILARLTLTLEPGPLQDSDLVIEAVFENLGLKHAINEELEPLLAKDGVWASNTSALPIFDVGAKSRSPQSFIGLHFFSPVEQMPLLEIITTSNTSDATLARCLAFCQRIKKLPVVVNDGYGFYTTRVFSAYIMEGANLVAEGHDPVLIEWAARAAGMVVPPLQVFDEVTLTLGVKANEQGRDYLGDAVDSPGMDLVRALVANGRTGKADGAGFYNYEGGKRRGLWDKLTAHASSSGSDPLDAPALQRRLLLAQAVQAVRCLEGGILRSARDGDVAAVFGIGFAPQTGGPFGWLDRQDLPTVIRELDALSASCGQRFTAPELLRDMAAQGRRFFDTPRAE
jgi:3-hydroxyacyl-CoA dehydrogenase/enoyl-CoA hydratase/3-hydroxybutyryl-CoA epimerase